MGGENGRSESTIARSVRFCLPSLPKSANSLYYWDRVSRSKKLYPECLTWKTVAKERIPRFAILNGSSVRIDFVFHYPFLYQNQKPRVFDSANLLKLAIDAIAEKCGFNDYLVRAGSWESRDSEDERVEVTMTEITNWNRLT